MNKLCISLLAATIILAPACGNKEKPTEPAKPAEQTVPATMVKLNDKIKADAIYKIVPAKDFTKDNATNCVKLQDNDKEFIHAVKGEKLEKKLTKHYKGMTDIVVLQLDEKVLNANGITIKMEKKKPESKTEYPHLYGKKEIPAAAVVEVIAVEEHEGSWMAK